MKHSILYYPYININDGLWIRNALLYWDEVCSIIPYDYYSLSNFMHEIIQEEACRLIYLHHQDELLRCNENFNKEICKINDYVNNKVEKVSNHQMFDEFTTMIHYNKISENTIKLLESSGIIRGVEGQPWFVGDSYAINSYMSILAKYIAYYEEDDMVISTDASIAVNLPYGRAAIKDENLCLNLIFEKALPTPNNDASIKKILKLKHRYRDEFLQLRFKIKELEQSLNNCEDYPHMKSIIADFRDSWIQQVVSIEQLMRENHIENILGTAKTVLGAGTPELIKSLNTCGINLEPWLVMATTGAMGGVGIGRTYLNSKRRNRELIKDSEFMYYFRGKQNGIFRRSDFVESV